MGVGTITGQDGVDNNPALQRFTLIWQGLNLYLEQRPKKPSNWSWMSKMLIIDVYCWSLKKINGFFIDPTLVTTNYFPRLQCLRLTPIYSCGLCDRI